jgi:hypothetical protein
MHFALIILKSHDVCFHASDLYARCYATHMLALRGHLKVLKKVRGVGHASQCVVINPNWVGVHVKTDAGVFRLGVLAEQGREVMRRRRPTKEVA